MPNPSVFFFQQSVQGLLVIKDSLKLQELEEEDAKMKLKINLYINMVEDKVEYKERSESNFILIQTEKKKKSRT